MGVSANKNNMNKIKHSATAEGNETRYRSPQIKGIHMMVQNVLCQSGDGPMNEKDYGDGGFHNA